MPRFQEVWRRVRSALIAFALLAGLIDGFPIPTARVMRRLPPALQAICLRARDVQAALLAPLRPIKEAFGFSQRWSMFSSAGGTRHRMWIEARAASSDEWILLYRAGDPGHALFADTLEFRRVRNLWNPNRRGPKRSYPAFASWLARAVLSRDASLEVVRVRFERGELLDSGFQPTGDFDYAIERRRGEVLP